jgi:putative peptidoglycan lipid II flippase
VFQRGEFTAADTAHAVPSMICYALGIGAYSAQAIVARAFYARHDTLTPVLGGMFIAFGIFLPLNLVLFHVFFNASQPWLTTQGPALATSIGATLNFLLLFVLLQRKLGGMGLTRIFKSLARVIVGCAGLAAVAGGFSWWVVNDLRPARFGSLLEVLVGGGAGLALYGILTYLLGSDEARQVGEILRGRLRKRLRKAAA